MNKHSLFSGFVFVVLVVLANCFVAFSSATTWGDPIADPNAIYITSDGSVRVTVLTDQLMRVEWSSLANSFVDAKTIAISNRKLTVPNYNVAITNGVLRVNTSKLELNYKIGSGKFTKDNTQMLVYNVAGSAVSYHYGDEPTGNLLGTLRTLDKTGGARELYCPNLREVMLHNTHCSLGVVSRDGWAVVNDTAAAQFDDGGSDGWQWLARVNPTKQACNISILDRITCRPNDTSSHDQTTCQAAGCCWHALEKTCSFPVDPIERLDFYFFGHGHNYLQAIKDFTKISGPIPLVPRYAMGTQYSRWFAYNEIDERLFILENGYQQHTIPIDVIVLDMDWHVLYHHTKTYCSPHFDPWTAFTWNTNLWTSPKRFLDWATNTAHLHVTLNNHPDRGVQCVEAKYTEMALAMGMDPSTNQTVRYSPEEKLFTNNFFSIVLDPIHDDGISYWWVDYQQGEALIYPGVNPTFWVNYIFSTSPQWWSGTERGLLMARWGGLGNHRYRQIGFSGDVKTTWESLDFQPYFTTTASNVGFSWSHDLGGFSGQPEAELYTRWIQWGVFSPMTRIHCDKHYYREIWLYPYEDFIRMRQAMQLRFKLVPYIYSSTWETYQSGIGLLRPMYYEWSEFEEAYSFKNEYMFGPDIMVHPITAAGDSNGIATKQVWIPPGSWIEFYSGQLFTGPQIITRQFLLDEIPVYMRSGAIVPMRILDKTNVLGRAQETPDQLQFLVYVSGMTPGSTSKFTLYDDDGHTTLYETGSYYTTMLKLDVTSYTTFSFTINPPSGNGFAEMPTSRSYVISFLTVLPPSQVVVGTTIIPEDTTQPNAADKWSYDAAKRSLVVTLGTKRAINKVVKVDVTLTGATNLEYLTTDYSHKLHAAQLSKQKLDSMWGTYYPDDYPSLLRVAATGLNTTTTTAQAVLSQFNTLYENALSEVNLLSASDTKTYCLNILTMNM